MLNTRLISFFLDLQNRLLQGNPPISLFFFTVEGNGAGFGNLEIVVNGGRVTCHVSRIEQQEKFSANFIPHEAGRHRLDVTFNGDKVPHSPWFCEVRIRKKTCRREKKTYLL